MSRYYELLRVLFALLRNITHEYASIDIIERYDELLRIITRY